MLFVLLRNILLFVLLLHVQILDFRTPQIIKVLLVIDFSLFLLSLFFNLELHWFINHSFHLVSVLLLLFLCIVLFYSHLLELLLKNLLAFILFLLQSLRLFLVHYLSLSNLFINQILFPLLSHLLNLLLFLTILLNLLLLFSLPLQLLLFNSLILLINFIRLYLQVYFPLSSLSFFFLLFLDWQLCTIF